MSNIVSSGVWQCGPTEMVQQFLMVAIADNADDFGFAFPSVDTLAFKTRCNKRTVMRQLDNLEAQGWIRVFRKAINGRQGKGNAYLVNIAKLGVTESPKGRPNPVLSRLLIELRDTESPIFLSPRVGDTDVREGDFPQPEKVTLGRELVQQGDSDDRQGDSQSRQGDSAVHRNHHNHQEPIEPTEPSVSEPPTDLKSPLPPTGGASTPTRADEESFYRLRMDLRSGLKHDRPLHLEKRFPELQPGRNDYDACFSAWWLVGVERTSEGALVRTESDDPELTRQGLHKYAARIAAYVKHADAWWNLGAVVFTVTKHAERAA